jgi:hypothetical protein
MPIAPDPVDTIERFAELSALLDDPHALRSALLAGVGLDDRTWRAIEGRWMARLKEPGGAALADQLGAVYAETKRNLSDALGPPTDPAPPSPPPVATLRSPLPPPPSREPAPEGVVRPASAPPRRAPRTLADTLESQGLTGAPALPLGEV